MHDWYNQSFQIIDYIFTIMRHNNCQHSVCFFLYMDWLICALDYLILSCMKGQYHDDGDTYVKTGYGTIKALDRVVHFKNVGVRERHHFKSLSITLTIT